MDWRLEKSQYAKEHRPDEQKEEKMGNIKIQKREGVLGCDVDNVANEIPSWIQQH